MSGKLSGLKYCIYCQFMFDLDSDVDQSFCIVIRNSGQPLKFVMSKN